MPRTTDSRALGCLSVVPVDASVEYAKNFGIVVQMWLNDPVTTALTQESPLEVLIIGIDI